MIDGELNPCESSQHFICFFLYLILHTQFISSVQNKKKNPLISQRLAKMEGINDL